MKKHELLVIVTLYVVNHISIINYYRSLLRTRYDMRFSIYDFNIAK